MSELKITRRPKVDDEGAAAEQIRRDELAGSDAYQRGVQHALRQELANVRGELATRLGDLAKCTVNRDFSQAGRDAYSRCWNNCLKAAQRLKSIVENEDVSIPDYIPPPSPTEQKMLSVGVPRPDGSYRETLGLGKSGKGLPPPAAFGSAADSDWMETGGGGKS
jgi:hypothetical protein